MPKPRPPVTSPRKAPVQKRSTQLVADILKAAVRVLEKEGAERFTTIRVAKAAGVSVGSLYQYFPNKQAILYRLQTDEWEQTGRMVDAILSNSTETPAERLHTMTRAFFRSECDEAPLRQALDRAAPSYHDAPESVVHRERGRKVIQAFIAEAAPRASARQRRLAADLLFMTVTAIGKQVSERRPSPVELEHWADAVAEMIATYLATLGAPG
ncbi:MAG TPA: TetR family transcriptional regulator [Polyangiaceae bacterium]|nr:TetR family transcriptional regulator [Polyangiaceae bacterium]